MSGRRLSAAAFFAFAASATLCTTLGVAPALSDRFLFTCAAPENVTGAGSISLSPGLTVGVTCHNVSGAALGGNSSGPGVATVYSNCVSSWVSPGQSAFPYLTTLGNPSLACTQSLATTSFVWTVVLSSGGGGQVFCCPRK